MAEAAASVAGLISFSVGIFKGCVEGYQILCAAKHAENNISKVKCFLHWQELRFIEWGRQVKIDGDTAGQNHFLPWHIIAPTLEELQRLFENSNKLKERYGLETATGNDRNVGPDRERDGIARLWSHASPEVRAWRARVADGLGPVRRLKWVAVDHDKISKLVTDLTEFNDRLYEVLEARNQDFIRSALSALIQDLISRTNHSPDLDTIKALNNQKHISNHAAIQAAADLKQVRIQVGGKPLPNAPKIKGNILRWEAVDAKPRDGNRGIATYKNSNRKINSWILLEWKKVPREQQTKLKRRVQSLTLLLEQATDPAFGTLRCLGLVSRDMDPRVQPEYAYAYELTPRNVEPEVDTPPNTPSLRDLLRGTWPENASRWRPSLTLRVEYARHLATAVLQLHTAGWLHKSIRSTNMLFVTRPGSQALRGPYLVGFEYARADNPLEMTEMPTQRPETDLYRHPKLLGPGRPDFCKAFDLYSLGCVLIEIALWTQLETVTTQVLLQEGDSWNFASDANSLLKDVAFAAGDTYAEAVRRCLFPQKDESGEDSDDTDASVCNEMEVARLLRSCQY